MSNPKTAIDSEHADIVYPSAIPFVLVHLACIAACEIRLKPDGDSEAKPDAVPGEAGHHSEMKPDTVPK
jgi:hypothetical protein